MRSANGSISLPLLMVYLVLVTGVACFLFIKLLNGQRELSNSTDAGALNVAKQAIKHPKVDVSGSDFTACSTSGNHQIELLTYNRCVAQTLLVALNAKQENNALALSHAQMVLEQLHSIGRRLTKELSSQNHMQVRFNQVASENSTHMLGGRTNADRYDVGFMKPAQSTNVYFYKSTFPEQSTPDIHSIGSDVLPPLGSTGRYMAGYKPMLVNGLSIIGVPVFPRQNPHLVAVGDFNDAKATDDYSPPNSFMLGSKCLHVETNHFAGALACAIVGTTDWNQNSNAQDFPGAIPGGYIEIVNLPGKALNASIPIDNSDNLFNNELYFPPGIEITQINHSALFTTDVGQLNAWKAYNLSTGVDVNGHDATLFPPSLGYQTSNVYVSSHAGDAGVPATSIDMLLVKGGIRNCLTDLNTTGLTGPCLDFLGSFGSTYRPGPQAGQQAVGQLYSNVDVVKAAIIDAFQKGQQQVIVTAPDGASGLGKYPFGPHSNTPTPQVPLPIQKTGTILELLNQVADSKYRNCNAATTVDQIVQRCNEILPTVKRDQVLTLLNTSIPMGTTFYIYLKGTELTISTTKPATYSGIAPDGNSGLQDSCQTNTYTLIDTLIDTKCGEQFPEGDNLLHSQPYQASDCIGGMDLMGIDVANWTLASGYGNLLGRLEFSNNAEGKNQFSCPN